MPATNQILAFNRRPTAPLGILTQFPINLEGKMVCINVMEVQGPLYFNLLLGRDYVYAMKVVVYKLFRVMNFHHDGNIVNIDQLSFLKPDHCMNPSHHTSPNFPHVLVVPSLSLTMSLDFDYHAKVQTRVSQ